MSAAELRPDPEVRTKEFKIGCIGAGMIMAECHLAAYADAGFPVVAIGSRTAAKAAEVAKPVENTLARAERLQVR